MFRIRLPNGVEMVFPSVEEFQAAVASGVVTPDSEIFHQKAERWVPIASHPTYHRAVSAARAAAGPAAPAPSPAPVAAPVRRVVPVTPATLASAARPAVAPAPAAPRPAVAPPISQSAQRPRVAAEPQAHAAPVMPPLGVSAQRPAISIPAPVTAAPAPRPVLRTSPPPAPVAPPSPPPAPVPAPARAARSSELKFVDLGMPVAEPPRPAAPLQGSAARPAMHSAPAPAIMVEAPARPASFDDLTDGFDILEDIGSDASAATVELPARPVVQRPEPAAHVPPPPASARPARPSIASHPVVEPVHEVQLHTPAAAPVPRAGSGRWLIAAGLGAALIGGGALVAWRSGGSRAPTVQAQVPAPNATTSAYTQTPKPESVPSAPLAAPQSTTPAVIIPVSNPTTSQKPASAEPKPTTQAPQHTVPATTAAPAVDTATILPGRPQSMSVDFDVSNAVVGTNVSGGAAASAGPSLGTLADHYGDAATDAGKQLEARLNGIGFSRLIAPLRFGSVESMEGARHTLSSAVGMVASYRSRMQGLEKIYGDSASQAQRASKATPKEMLAWDHRLPQRESAEAAQAVDLALSKVDQLYAALLAHPEQVKVDASSVTISDPDLAKQYQGLKQWLSSRFDNWGSAPVEAVPPTVRQTMKAFSDALTH